MIRGIAQQLRQGVTISVALLLQRGQCGAGAFQLCLGLEGVAARDLAGRLESLCQVELRLEFVDQRARHIDLRLASRVIETVHDHLVDQRDVGVECLGAGAGRCCRLRLDGPAHAAENIEIVGQRQPDIELIAGRAESTDRLIQKTAIDMGALEIATGIESRQRGAGDGLELVLRREQPVPRGLEVGVVGQGFLHQCVQRLRAKQAIPIGGDLGAENEARSRSARWRRAHPVTLSYRGLGAGEIGTECAGGHSQRRARGQDAA